MTNTMADLRREVANRLRDTLHGKEIDTLEKGTPETPHMLGIVTLGAITTPEAEKGTLLDPEHSFWGNYYKNIESSNGVKREVETAMRSLKEDGIFRVTTPYGDDAGILYVECDYIRGQNSELVTSCMDCGSTIATEPEIVQQSEGYAVRFFLDCPSCQFSKTLLTETELI